MKPGVTYIICPDKKCKLFWEPSVLVPCDGHCPRQSEQKLVIICRACEQNIVLDGGHFKIRRVDCKCGGSNFGRMSGKYHLLYKLP
ncbi:MAG: hypothetical protein UT75_C0001G0114 [Candidatus Yanofskybacteria bacterium GW2011_GWE2_40_11]|uniref:Uncharacterized protein n=1 Tax=Candidatus Yanofskybacteria bacterium GW2011_GWE2_40_11 TaxID=1619033 RepID=A0A0G0T294_9BACT|nr:MAG: hypothetical protein UT75_C0001G0114 [Candidatus Yanofskybacteria bacterium GW2011_GWE2_40_11]